MEPQQNTKTPLSIPNAIIAAGLLIAGAVLLTNYYPTNKALLSNTEKGGQESQYDANGNLNLGTTNAVSDIAVDQVKASPTLAPVSDVDHVRYAGTASRAEALKNAKLTVIEYSDLECPFCKVFHPTMQKIVDAYPGQVVWIYRHFPLDSIHSKARNEANASECAYEQGGDTAFWKYIDEILSITPSNNKLDPAKLSSTASDLGLDMSKFATCLQNGTYVQKVQTMSESGLKAGVEGTPASFIVTRDGKYAQILGAEPYETVKAKVDGLLKN